MSKQDWLSRLYNLSEEEMCDDFKHMFFRSARHVRGPCDGYIEVLGKFKEKVDPSAALRDISNITHLVLACSQCNFRSWMLANVLKKELDIVDPNMFSSLMSDKGLIYFRSYVNPEDKKI